MRTVCVAAPCPRHFSGPLGPKAFAWVLGVLLLLLLLLLRYQRSTKALTVSQAVLPEWVARTWLRPPSLATYRARSAATNRVARSSSWCGWMVATPMLTVIHGEVGE